MLLNMSQKKCNATKKRIETMKSQHSKALWNLKLGILGLALSASPLLIDVSFAGEIANAKTLASKKNQNNISAVRIDDENPYKLDKIAAARKPEGRVTVHNVDSALEAAYRNNTELKELQAQVRSKDEGVPQALAGWRPTVYANASIGKEKDIYSGSKKETGDNGNTLARSGDTYSTAEADITLQQNLFNGGQTVAKTCQAENLVQAARSLLADKEREVLFATVQAYFAVIARTAELEYRRSNEKSLKATLDATRAKYDVGEETRTSIAQAEASLAQGTAEREASEATLLSAEATFERVTGARPGKLNKPGEPAILPHGLKEAIEIAKKNNPAILAALYQEKADRSAIKVSDADLLPKIDLNGSIGRSATIDRYTFQSVPTQTHDFQTTEKVSVNLRVPLYEGGAFRGRTRELREVAEQSRIKIETKRREVIQDLVTAWETYLAAKANVKSYKTQVQSDQVSLEGTRQEMLVGSKILLDVLNAQRELVSAQLRLVQAEQSYHENAYKVLAIMGRLTAMDMKLKVKRYDPQVHYQDVRNSW